ncbi:T9SS type A sorting domain-containing protein [Flavisolibacter tropicus]|uniref:Secretion system C-terminal sorting domain-containing protein n=1 Tax=Flavisolibacter tropicus TaxID=1492898 RepID=A0A172TXC2_9BACT|nr:T9SS type A sorting domain-containing protein [Flavisolibacter tropicus]ANE51745.1 hypothetical protein SY85_15825 [Flavisolibacter tropicus]
MRKYLLCFFVSCIIASVTFAQSCGVGNPIISNASTYSTADSCYAIFDLTVGLKANGGNKFVGISLWMASTYKQPTYSKVPDETDLSKALGTIVIDNNNSSLTPQLLNVFTSYPYVQGNTNQNVRILRSNGLVNRTYKAATDSFYFNISNIIIAAKRVTPTSCPVELLTIKGDLWSSNSGSVGPNTSVQCVALGAISFSLGDPLITAASRNCTIPRSLNFTIGTTSSTPITVTYDIFKDDNVLNTDNDPFFDPGTDTKVATSAQPITTLTAFSPYTATNVSYAGADQTSSDGKSKFWVVVYYTPTIGPTAGQTYSVTRLITDECPQTTPLPVKLKSFNAKRNKEKVLLTWETAMEASNSGFDVQRKIGNEDWKTVAFVFSKADGGNSRALLNYEYADVNLNKGVTQYRLRQVDIDTRYTLSEIRSVGGESQAAQLLVYPNPSTDGKVNLVFEDKNATHSISVSDMTGREVKQYRNITAGSLQIDGLNDGIYTLHITDINTAATTVQKIIVKKR